MSGCAEPCNCSQPLASTQVSVMKIKAVAVWLHRMDKPILSCPAQPVSATECKQNPEESAGAAMEGLWRVQAADRLGKAPGLGHPPGLRSSQAPPSQPTPQGSWKPSQRVSSGPDISLANSTKHLKKKQPNLHNVSQIIKEKRILPHPSYEDSITPYQNHTKTVQEKKCMQTNVHQEHRHENLHQSASWLYSIIYIFANILVIGHTTP